jgi:hypothetical protein
VGVHWFFTTGKPPEGEQSFSPDQAVWKAWAFSGSTLRTGFHPASPLSKGYRKYEYMRENRSMMRKNSSMERLPGSQSSIELASRPTGIPDFTRPLSRSQSVREIPSPATGRAENAVTDFTRPLSRSQSVNELASHPPEEASRSTNDFLRPRLRSRSLEQAASQPIGSESHPELSLPSGDEVIQRHTEPESQQPSLVVVSDRISSADDFASASIPKLLEGLGISPGDEDYAVNRALAQGIADDLTKMEELKKSIIEASQSLAAASNLKWYNRMYSPPVYRVDRQVDIWRSDLQIAELDSRLVELGSRLSSNMFQTLTKMFRKLSIEGHKKAIRSNDWLAGRLVNPPAKLALALGIAAVGSISSSVIANEVLVSAVVSNILATGVETRLFEKVSFPLNVISNGVQWTGMNTGAFLLQKRVIEKHNDASHRNETIRQGRNFTTDEFAGLLADPFGNTTIERILAGRLDELTKSGTITIEWTHNV